MSTATTKSPKSRARIPEWLRFRIPDGAAYRATNKEIRAAGVATVCEEARCPNVHDCWSRHTATVMILGDTCTRGCRFCSVATSANPAPPDPGEPARVAALAATLGWRYVVLTSVDRDDLPDAGAAHYAMTVRALRQTIPNAHVEVLVPDFGGVNEHLDLVLAAEPHVMGHNLETVRRVSPLVRDRRASYEGSLQVLAHAAAFNPRPLSKSALMLGLGETRDELHQTLIDLREADVDVVALGQYLQPDRRSIPVDRYLPPEEFDDIAKEARALGFKEVSAGPLVRSSYHSEEFIRHLLPLPSSGTGTASP